jgi:hypothetical protein
MAGQKPRLLPEEPKLGRPTVRVRFHVAGESLPAALRVNYSKLVTVEHDVRVFIVGSVLDEDNESVYESVNACWEERTLGKQRRHGPVVEEGKVEGK